MDFLQGSHCFFKWEIKVPEDLQQQLRSGQEKTSRKTEEEKSRKQKVAGKLEDDSMDLLQGSHCFFKWEVKVSEDMQQQLRSGRKKTSRKTKEEESRKQKATCSN
ncbi:uncharacterized protein LOC116850322 isoform X2 [Odontomachus brunneus]|uniref:uncharacterized protein LOC116850322 isoform X2 n=1 Tax=Odontomachus brunneus TaxID=486640 RepID=UPI0013F1A570|nr:uncharacterized protein LOC116850322 isoform X2 [Odontomachus brunneus]